MMKIFINLNSKLQKEWVKTLSMGKKLYRNKYTKKAKMLLESQILVQTGPGC